jgi:hypothetical protein
MLQIELCREITLRDVPSWVLSAAGFGDGTHGLRQWTADERGLKGLQRGGNREVPPVIACGVPCARTGPRDRSVSWCKVTTL